MRPEDGNTNIQNWIHDFKELLKGVYVLYQYN